LESIKNTTTDRFETKRSTFITELHPIADAQAMQGVLRRLREKHSDASHHCFGAIIGMDGELERFDDDGEPSQTAGMPILQVLKKNNLTNVLCVVVRYYGGIKLGAGGLIRAYKKGASNAVQKAVRTRKKTFQEFCVELDFALGGKIESFLRQNAHILDRHYGNEKMSLTLRIEKSVYEGFLEQLREKTKGAFALTPLKSYTVFV